MPALHTSLFRRGWVRHEEICERDHCNVTESIADLIINLTEKAHTTSIIVTHELSSAFHIATRIAMLFQGRIIEEDRPERFRASHNPVIEQFIEGRTEGPIH